MTAPFRIELLDQHERTGFHCGVEALDQYLRVQAGQDMRRRVSFCYVAVDCVDNRIAGYYTLAAGSVALHGLPAATVRKLPRYPTVPVVRIGRLAVDARDQGRRLGGALLMDAIARTCRAEIAAFAVIVDAKDDRAAEFYEHHGFRRFESAPLMLFLPISDALRNLSQK